MVGGVTVGGVTVAAPQILNEGEAKTFENIRVHLLGLPSSVLSFRCLLQQASNFIAKMPQTAASLKISEGLREGPTASIHLPSADHLVFVPY